MKFTVEDCLKDASVRLNTTNNNMTNMQDCKVHSWEQEWPDTSCGFSNNMCGFGITKALCVVIIGPNEDACVYHNGRLAYYVPKVSDKFYNCIDNELMPAANQDADVAELILN